MKKKTLAAVAAAAAAFAAAEELHDYKLMFIPRAKAPVKIDGRVDKAEWAGAAKITDFGGGGYSYGADQYMPPTEARMMWDDKYLYIACVCHEDTAENMAKFKVDIADESGLIFSHDTVEFHLNGPNPGELPKCQVFLTPLAAKEILRIYDNGWGRETDSDYGRVADWDKAHYIGDDFWSMEAKIAHESLGTTPRVGFRLGLNIGRLRFNKNFVKASDRTPTSVRFAEIFCWANRKESQHSTRHGRGIFVESEPANVVEGLRLSYPDLDRRKVMVQTDKAYVVVENGKPSELGYLDKARQLAAEALKKYSRIADLTNAVPEPVKGLYARCFAAVNGECAKIAGKGREYAAAASCDVGELAAFGELAAKFETAVDNAYYAALRQLMLVEGKVRFPVKLEADPAAPKLERQFADAKPAPWKRVNDAVRWARPSARGTVRAFICVEFGDAYAAWELMHRLDIDADVFVMNDRFHLGRGALKPSQEHHYTEAQKRAMLETTLAENDYPLYIFIGGSPSAMPPRVQCAIAERVLAGARVVSVNGDDWGYKLAEDRGFLEGVPSPMSRLVAQPERPLDCLSEECRFPPLRRTAVGRGSYAAWNPGKSATYLMYTSLLPGWSFAPDDMFQDEYCYAAAAKAVAEGLGLRGAVKVAKVAARPAAAGAAVTVDASLVNDGEALGVKAVLVVRDRSGKVVAAPAAAEFTAAKGVSHASFVTPPLGAGRYYADVFLIEGDAAYDGRGFTAAKTADWASGAFELKKADMGRCGCTPVCRVALPPAAIAGIMPEKRIFKKDEDITAAVAVTNSAEGLAVYAELRDPRGRVIERGDFAVGGGGKAQVVFSGRRLVENCHIIAAALKDAKGAVIDRREKDVYRKIGRRDDFTVFSDGFFQGGVNGLKRGAVLDYYGIGCCQNGSPARLMFGGDPVARYRIAGAVSDIGGSMASPFFLKRIGERFRKVAAGMADKNGLFISCGDDSGIPSKFTGTVPDWVPAFLEILVERLRGMEKGGLKGHQTIKQWCNDRGLESRCSNYGSFASTFRPLGAIPKLIDALRYPADFADVAAAVRRTYLQKNGVEHFNRQNGVEIKSWSELTPAVIKSIKPTPSSEFVEFQFWLRDEVYCGSVEKLNAAWKTSLKDFFEITPETIVEQKNKGFLAAELDRRNYMRHILVTQFRTVREQVRKVDRDMQIFMGCSRYFTLVEPGIMTLGSTCPYWGKKYETEMFRRLKRQGGMVGETLGTYNSPKLSRDQRDRDVWHALLTGDNMCWFWSTFIGFRGDLAIEDGLCGYTLDALREIKRGPASLALRSRRENDAVRILFSTRSAFLEGLRSEFGSTEACCKSFQALLEGAGYQYDYFFESDIEAGAAEKEKVKVLVLPAAQRLSAKTCEGIRKFVADGGAVIADFRPATVAEDGSLLERGALDDVFGVRREGAAAKAADVKLKVEGFGGGGAFTLTAGVDASYRAAAAKAFGAGGGAHGFFLNTFGKGRALLLNFNSVALKFTAGTPDGERATEALAAALALGGVPSGRIAAFWTDGSRVLNTEISRFTRGAAEYVGFEKCPFAGEKLPGAAALKFPGKAWTYDVRKGAALGFVDSVALELKGFDTAFFTRLPYEVKGLKVTAPGEVRRGDTLRVGAEVVTEPAVNAATHVLRVDLVPPGGYSPERFAPVPYRLIDAPCGKGAAEIAIAWNEKSEYFTLEVTDVATGATFSRRVDVR